MQATAGPSVGEKAPEFKLKGPGGQTISLSEHLGRKNVLLVFYPLAFSPVCSHQLPAIEREIGSFTALDAVVMGVSVDSHYANTAFAERLRLSFPLLSDFRKETSAAYGMLLDSGHSGRALFVIDKQGRIAYRDIAAVIGDMDQIPSNAEALAALEGLR